MSALRILSLIFVLSPLVFGNGGSGDSPEELSAANLKRTQALTEKVNEYLTSNGVMVALLSRRGKITDASAGVSDVDNIDATGMAHTGFVVRTGFSGNNQYMTMNLVCVSNEDKDTSQLRAWSLEQFFVASGEKDAIITMLRKEHQLALWNALTQGMSLEASEVEIQGQKATRQVIKGGFFNELHVPEYNLVSDYVYNQTQNCNEHLVKTLAAVVHNKRNLDEISLHMAQHFQPFELHISGFKRWMANKMMGMRLGSGERVIQGKPHYRVITVECIMAPVNREYLGIEKIQVFREARVGLGYQVFNCGGHYLKKNTATNKLNKQHFKHGLAIN